MQVPVPAVIGLCGYAGAGKDAVFRAMQELRTDVVRVAFADALKTEVAEACGVPLEELEQNKPKFRELLQAWGVWRRSQNPDYWVSQAADKCYVVATEGKTSVITDVRFQNEVGWIKENGGVVIRVERTGVGAVNAHVSEHEWTTAQFDYVIENNGTLGELKADVLGLIQKWV